MNKRGAGVASSGLSFYIILTQTLCAHDTLQDRKQRSSALWFDVCMTDEHFRDDSKTPELKLLDSCPACCHNN